VDDEPGGHEPARALRTGTINPARALGMDRDLGSLEPGKLADLIVLDANPLENIRNSTSVRWVVANGRVYEAATMNEVGTRQRPRAPFWFEAEGGSGGSQRRGAGREPRPRARLTAEEPRHQRRVQAGVPAGALAMSVKLKPLAEQVIVVTGASSGIGLTIARRAAGEGAKVVLAARDEAALRQVVDEIVAEGGQAAYAVADVGNKDDVAGSSGWRRSASAASTPG
jgi:hypothetical protein